MLLYLCVPIIDAVTSLCIDTRCCHIFVALKYTDFANILRFYVNTIFVILWKLSRNQNICRQLMKFVELKTVRVFSWSDSLLFHLEHTIFYDIFSKQYEMPTKSNRQNFVRMKIHFELFEPIYDSSLRACYFSHKKPYITAQLL